MRKIMKKVIATVCAMAMVVGSVAINNNTTIVAEEQTAQSERTEAAGFADLLNEAFLNGDVGQNQYKATCGKGLIAGIVNIQQMPGAAEFGIYVTFKDANIGEMTVNGVKLNAFVEGSGVTMYLTNFKYMYSDVVVKNADGTQKAVVYVYNAQGIDNSDKALEQETPEPAEITMQRVSQNAAYQEFGSFKMSASPVKEVYAGVDPGNRDRIKVQNASGPNNENFNVVRTFKGLTSGVKYVLSVDITPSVANGRYKTLKDTEYKNLVDGTTTVSMVSTAYPNNGVAQADFSLDLRYLGSDVVLEISNPQFRVATEEDLTTQAPTTQAPTTIAPTTQAPTTVAPTTKAPTTVAPTTQVPTNATATVKPTTKAPSKIKAPKKAIIKKITPKKKASAKVKISLTKIKGAKGYQVAVYKTKKNAKNNKKALIKKVYTKRNVVVNSKKLKNKKTLYVRVRAYVLNSKGNKVFGKWSTIKKVKIKK